MVLWTSLSNPLAGPVPELAARYNGGQHPNPAVPGQTPAERHRRLGKRVGTVLRGIVLGIGSVATLFFTAVAWLMMPAGIGDSNHASGGSSFPRCCSSSPQPDGCISTSRIPSRQVQVRPGDGCWRDAAGDRSLGFILSRASGLVRRPGTGCITRKRRTGTRAPRTRPPAGTGRIACDEPTGRRRGRVRPRRARR